MNADVFYTGVIIILAVLLIIVLLRAIIGPTIGDRIMAINMIGTITIMIICILSIKMDESFLGDVPLVYALISFIAVVILSKIFIGVHKEKNSEEN